jgi:hypothetical protein
LAPVGQPASRSAANNPRLRTWLDDTSYEICLTNRSEGQSRQVSRASVLRSHIQRASRPTAPASHASLHRATLRIEKS